MDLQKGKDFILPKNSSNIWRTTIICSFIIALSILYFGCSKADEVNDEYYVKYEVNSTTIYSGGKLDVKLNAETNQIKNITVNTRSPFEVIIGPVKKGFNASLDVQKQGTVDNQLRLYIQISVSKNGSPFALKEINGSDTPRNTAQLTYTIDY
jgi:hypothetical protein